MRRRGSTLVAMVGLSAALAGCGQTDGEHVASERSSSTTALTEAAPDSTTRSDAIQDADRSDDAGPAGAKAGDSGGRTRRDRPARDDRPSDGPDRSSRPGPPTGDCPPELSAKRCEGVVSALSDGGGKAYPGDQIPCPEVVGAADCQALKDAIEGSPEGHREVPDACPASLSRDQCARLVEQLGR